MTAEPTSRMTISVYRIAGDGQRTTIREARPVAPAELPEESSRWPRCQCPHHRTAR